MQKALERTNPHRRHIAELTNDINWNYITRKVNEPIHFGGLKKELIMGGQMIRPNSYRSEVIREFSVKNNMPKPDMRLTPDTLAVGKPIHFINKYEIPEMKRNMKDDVLSQVSDNEYEKIKDMNMKDLNKYLKIKESKKKKEEARVHPAVKQKRLQRRLKEVEKIESERMPESNEEYNLDSLFGSGRRIGLPKPKMVGGKVKRKYNKRK